MSGSNRSSAAGFEVSIAGTKYQQAADASTKGVQLLTIEDHVDMVDMLTLRMGGTEGQAEWAYKIGDEVTAKVGEGNNEIFKGQIIALEPSYQVEGISQINIRAMDSMHKLGRGRVTRFFEDMKDSDVVAAVASEAGISTGTIEATEETNPYILQRNESNVAFLKRMAARNNYILRMEDGNLSFKKAQFSGSVFTLAMGDNLRSLRMSYNTVDQVQKVVVRGWDITKKEAIVGEATTGDIDKIGSGEVGADMAGQFGDSTAYVTDVPVFSQSAANIIAKVEMNRLARQFARGSATIQGNEEVRAGNMITIEGLQTGVNGDYFVLASRHIISNRTGYSTEFSFCGTSYGS
ncbi:MAG: phage late control D family protein [Proteobacteria bacterium]|nr:phage late control D family protein [Pseudomonadota bacterium]MCP4922007.1 phage late control D family protein [Pseudomonadota bacterium]